MRRSHTVAGLLAAFLITSTSIGAAVPAMAVDDPDQIVDAFADEADAASGVPEESAPATGDGAAAEAAEPEAAPPTGPESSGAAGGAADAAPADAPAEITPFAAPAGVSVVAAATPSTYGADAQRAAAWLGRQLAAGGDVLPAKNGSTDWGLTIDALLALASAGVGGDQIQATAAKLVASGDAWIGAAAASDWARVAKMVLALEVAGLDPTQFGSRDLVAELRAQVSASGAFGTGDLFSQPIAVIALARTPGGVPASSVGWMLTQQCTTGENKGSFGWGCGAADADTTAMVVQALAAAGMPADDPAMTSAMAWLIGQQDASGGVGAWGLNTNSTGLAGQAFANIDASGSTAAASSASNFIGGLEITCDTVSANRALRQADVGAIAYDKTGWDDGLSSGLTTAGGSRAGKDANQSDEWWRATGQAVLGLGGPSLAELTAAGAERGLPEVACESTSEPSPSPSPKPGGGSSGGGVGTGGAAVDSLSALALAGAAMLIAVSAVVVLSRRSRVSR